MIMSAHTLRVLLAAVAILLAPASGDTIGVNYGVKGSDLAPPPKVAQFLRTKTIIDRVKIFDTNHAILRAFAGTNISVVMTAANGDIPKLAEAGEAAKWVEANVKPFHPKTKISCIAVGNEILHSLDYSLIDKLVPAMKTLHGALVKAGYDEIRVSTPSSLGILNASEPPSTGRFQKGWDVGVLKPMLAFLKDTKSPFMVNPYPYFGYDPTKLDFATFKPNAGKVDNGSGITYYNLFDQNMDAIYTAMKRVGYGDVDMMVAETGWPSKAEKFQPEITAASAAAYNGGLIKHVNSGKGTPLMPGRRFETYIFSLFNEKDKEGPTAEKNFGLFKPDFTPVYDCGVMLKEPKKDTKSSTVESPSPAESLSGESPSPAKSRSPKKAPSREKSDDGESGTSSDDKTPKTTEDGELENGSNEDMVAQGKSSSPVEAGAASFLSPDGLIKTLTTVLVIIALTTC